MPAQHNEHIEVAAEIALSLAQEAIDIRGMLSQMPGAENIFEKAQSAAAENLTKIVDKWWDKISKYNSKTDPIKSLGGGDGGGELGTPENIGITPNSEFQLPEEDPELLALIEAAPGINEYETILLKHIDGLVCISADVLPSLIRLLPAIKSGDLEAIGDSQDFTVLLQALREGIIKDEALRTDLIGLFGDWLKQASTQAIKEQTNDSIPPEVLNTLASDIDRLLTDPENQITLLNIILDDNVFPKILSGEDLDLATEAKIIGSLGAKGYSLWNLNHLQTTLSNFWGGMTTEVTTNLLWDSLTGPETEEEEETTDLTASIPDFLGEQANADQVALFFEENQDLLEAAGEDLPVLYLAVRALFNKDFDNPAINALANNESFGIMLTALREFTDQNSAFQEGVLEASGKGIVMVLKSFAPENESRDWDSIEGEINGLIAASPELQNDYLDFVFLQFDKGSFVEALQGNIDPLQLAGETLSIPFIRNLTNQLGNREQTPNLRTLLTETGIHAGLSLLGEEMQENEDWPILEAELRQLAENPELQDAFFGLLKEGNSTELLTGFQKIMAGDYLDGASTLLSNQNIQIILSELREFVRETDKTEEFLLNIAIVNLGDYLNDVYPQMANSALTESLRQIVVGNDVMRENILQLALNPYKINQVIEITRNITPENLEETVIALRDIPELNAILDNLPDILASDQGPSVVIKENITKVALNFATQNIPILQTPEGQELLQTIRPQITTFLRDSDVLQTGVAFGTTPEGAQVIEQILANLNNPQQIFSIIESVPELKAITEQTLNFVKTNTETQYAFLDYVCELDERFNPAKEFFERKPEALQSLMDLACDIENFDEFITILEPIITEKEVSSEFITSINTLAAYPGLQSFIDAFAHDFQENPDAWQDTIAAGTELIMGSLKEIVTEQVVDSFGSACLPQINQALDRVEAALTSNIEIQTQVVNFLNKPGNLTIATSLFEELNQDEINPVKIINLMGSSEELITVLDLTTDVLFSDPEFRTSFTAVATTYLDNLDTILATNDSDSSSNVDIEAIFDALMANEDLKSVLDGAISEVASDEWDESREELFTHGTEAMLEITRSLMEKNHIHFDSEKWGTISNRLSTFMGSNDAVQQAILHLATDLETMKALLNFSLESDFSILDHPDIKIIIEEIGNFFTQDAETWDLTKNTVFDAVYDKYSQDEEYKDFLPEKKKEKYRAAIINDLEPGIFNADKLITVGEKGAEILEKPNTFRIATRGPKIAQVLELSVGKILRAYV